MGLFGKKLKEYNLDNIEDFQYAKITTNKGIIWAKLFPDATPNTVANFAHLSNTGFYNGLKFHRVIKGFMAQGGCPNSKEGAFGMVGTGGPGWAIKCETNADKQIHKKGSLSMAHAGKDTGGSQFFICFTDCPHLNKIHTVFGGIEENDIKSFEVLDSIVQNDIIEKIEILKQRD